MNHASAFDGLGAITLSGLLVALLIWLFVFGLLSVVAAAVAPEGRRTTFFFLTLFILGPTGVGFAAVASPRASEPEHGKYAAYCVQCVARNLVDDEDNEFTCWQCDVVHEVEPRVAA